MQRAPGLDPFYAGSTSFPGIIYQAPILYLFPASLVATAAFTFTLNYIPLPINPDTGAYLTSGGTYDLPFTMESIQAIADIATDLFKKDDAKLQRAPNA